jgi:hypothetical protein
MSEMVERVARAMAADYNIRHDCQHGFDDVFFLDAVRDEWRAAARAAISAMREPTEAMVRAANRNNHPRDEETWRTMVDAALEE